jgi:hypothetical protein
VGEVVKFDVDAKRSAGGGTERRAAALTAVAYPGGGAPDVHVPLIAGGGHGPTPVVAEAGGTALERMGENVVAVEAVDRSREAPETADSSRAIPEQGSKCATPEQGMSDRPVKKARVRSKM